MVLVRIDEGVVRPLLVAMVQTVRIYERDTPTPEDAFVSSNRLSGTLFCEPDDHTRPALRGWSAGHRDPARITGRPDRLLPLAYGECLAEGPGIGQWRRRDARS